MDYANLPPTGPAPAPAFTDSAGARAWLSSQPRADPPRLLAALAEQLVALDAAGLPAEQLIPLLSLLYPAAVPVLQAADGRLLRKAVPLPAADQALFDAASRVRLGLALAKLRLAAGLAPDAAAPHLLQAAALLRQAQFACFQAAQIVPARLDSLLLYILRQAADGQLLTLDQRDPAASDAAGGEASIAGELLWAMLMRVQDPYRWSAAQLNVANRIVRRWRGLVAFAALPDADPRAAQVSLARLYPAFLLDGLPSWIGVRPILRKLRQRREALAAGESPEALKLGTELSATACGRLLDDMTDALRQLAARPVRESGECDLVFGGEPAYLYFTHRALNRKSDVRTEAIAKKRMEIFGFDYLSQLPGEKPKLVIPSERWQKVDGRVERPLSAGARRQAPALVAGLDGAGQSRLGCLQGLYADSEKLYARVAWYPAEVEAGYIERRPQRGMPLQRFPVFLLHGSDGALELLAPPAAGTANGDKVVFGDPGPAPVVLGEVRERGTDFVRYTCRFA